MTKTLLTLDLMVQEPCVDLRQMTQLVLSDLGAALQILRLAGRQYGNTDDRPIRMEDCISDLGLKACMQAVSAQSLPRDGRQYAIADFWDHSREIARHSKQIAIQMFNVNPEEAYLTGLFHTIGLLPELLGWRESGEADVVLVGLRFANGWSLPASVTEFFREIHFIGYPTLWSGIVREAHQSANRSFIDCPFEQGLRPHLVRNGTGQSGPANFQ